MEEGNLQGNILEVNIEWRESNSIKKGIGETREFDSKEEKIEEEKKMTRLNYKDRQNLSDRDYD